MKKNLLLLLAVICTVALSAQDAKKVFGSPTIIYYGLDFTKAKVIGFGDESPHKIRDEYFRTWTLVTVDMDLAKTFQKNAAYKDPNGLNKLNLARETDNLTATDETELTPDAIADMVKQVPVGLKKEGLGVSFIVQSFNKTADLATVWVTFFDVATHTVLLSKKETAKTSGKGVAGWTGALKTIFTNVEKKDFTAWKKEANY